MDTPNVVTAANETAQRAAACCGTAGKRVLEGFDKFRTEADSLKDNAVHKARNAAWRTGETVHQHPYSAIGVAALAGLVLGFMASRR
jgi:ElaB/YqjD/DUF883 family membrane-anchored ribosome-binding protein